MPLPFASSKAALTQFLGRQTNNNDALAFLIESMFSPREIVIAGTSLTISETHRGAILRFTSNSAITVTLPALDSGFLFGFLPYGTGTITFSGTTLGGSASSGQNILGSAWLMSTGEWLMTGAA